MSIILKDEEKDDKKQDKKIENLVMNMQKFRNIYRYGMIKGIIYECQQMLKGDQ